MNRKYLFGLYLMLVTLQMSSQDKFTGVWQEGNGEQKLIQAANWEKFNKDYLRLTNEGLRLTDVETFVVNGERLYTSVWKPGIGKHACLPSKQWPEFEQEYLRLTKEGLRLADVECFSQNGKRYYLSVWRPGTESHAMLPPKEWASFDSEWKRLDKEGFRLSDVETFSENGKRFYLGVWEKGSGKHALLPPMEWPKFEAEWKRISEEGLRIDDIEVFAESGKMYFLSSWRTGSIRHSLQNAVDKEGFTSHIAINRQLNLRLTDFETFPSDCNSECMNNVLAGHRSRYEYYISGSKLHCEGEPGTCPPGITYGAVYRSPMILIDRNIHIRHSALNVKDQIFTLPFKVPASDMNPYNGWLYDKNDWHWALDYSTGDPLKTFEVVAAAPGKVIHMGWDKWSGNTVVISHDAGGRRDVYRTIYMHLRNGPDYDCQMSWLKGVPASGNREADYRAYLNSCGCKQDSARRTSLPADKWGTDRHQLDTNLIGKMVNAGDRIGWVGSTGPGGFAGNHLHIFFAHRDPTDNRWYFFDPFGIYSYGSCYPAKVDGSINVSCVRYPVAWKNGKPEYAK